MGTKKSIRKQSRAGLRVYRQTVAAALHKVAAPGGTMDTGGAGGVAIATDFSILYAPRMPHPSLCAIASVCVCACVRVPPCPRALRRRGPHSRFSIENVPHTLCRRVAPSPAPRPPPAARTAT